MTTGIASLEDKIVQCAVVEILNAIYEPMFVGFSYGLRPGRSQHDALDALAYAVKRTAVNWVLDVDVKAFFDTVDHEWLIRLLEYRIGDRRLLRLIRKWLKAGVMANGSLLATMKGTPQGAVVSPVLANVYMHFVFDLWANQWRKRRARGTVIVVRYADDVVVGFGRRDDAQAFLAELRERLGTFSLTLHPEKTRLIEFGRYAAERRARRGEGKPETFSFLGFTHICGVSQQRRFLLIRKTRQDRMQAALRCIKEKLRERLNESVVEQGRWPSRVAQSRNARIPSGGSQNRPPVGSFKIDVRRETGKEYEVKVLDDEGVAIHIDPEPCIGVREGDGEASAGEHVGPVLSRES
jgi:RNA-directed DNA polymerase